MNKVMSENITITKGGERKTIDSAVDINFEDAIGKSAFNCFFISLKFGYRLLLRTQVTGDIEYPDAVLTGNHHIALPGLSHRGQGRSVGLLP